MEEKWYYDEAKIRLFRIVVSGLSLGLSLGKWLEIPYGIDIAWIAILLCGFPIVIGATKAVITEHDIKADVLVSIALIGCLIAREYFAAGEVAFIMEIGSALEDFTSEQARKGIEKLINIVPKIAYVRRSDKEINIPVEKVRIGDNLIIHVGEIIPVDGVIIKGNTVLDQSTMTGESIPVDKCPGDHVISGSINKQSVIEIKATSEEKDSILQRMIKLAKESDENKAPVVGLADRWATWLVLGAFAASILTGIVNGIVYLEFGIAFERAVTVLVVVCPCAFILATPTAIMAGIGNGTKRGLIIKSGEALQKFSTIDTICFDKTGTLTMGRPGIKRIVGMAGYSEDDVLRYTASAEKHSEHPLGKIIVNECLERGIEIKDVSEEKIIIGKGIKAVCDGNTILAGTKDLLKSYEIEMDSSISVRNVSTNIWVALNGICIGLIELADIVREEARETINTLSEQSIETVLLTGDNKEVGESLGKELGISIIKSELLPQDKQSYIQEMQKEGKKVCMIGDGINDAIALNTADAAIAMGGIGSDIAIELSDVVLVKDDIKRISYILDLSKQVMRKIRVNIILSLAINLISVLLAATGTVNSVVGALLHNFGSVFVVINSITLLMYKESK
ncbi:cation-translocating P-type ATPase [Eubacterium sp.]|uniref:heavy metal translocating P-type ATPase n=1 Tax=Eubacterium sp. TaxID=142586 RepID=UPI0025ED16C1|nr:cation-translocating P-type ATPase [Eubacterium sp.]